MSLSPALLRRGLLAWTAALTALVVMAGRPPQVVPATAPASVFSAERAKAWVQRFAVEPHPVGSPAHIRARELLVEELRRLGVEPELQSSVGVGQLRLSRSVLAAPVVNVLARLPGTASGASSAARRSLLLLAHYDSVPTGPGASDDAAGVAALLEVLRALKAGPPLQNDVLFLFSDAEEAGLLGAFAFVDEHPWAREVGAVVNLEARGTSGPSFLFQTSGNERWLLEQFAQSAPHPVTSSLAATVYSVLPNDTDLTVFRRAGIPGLNFAFIEGASFYHSMLDDPEHLDLRSLQHHGGHALALARQLGNADLSQAKGDAEAPGRDAAVFFDVLGRHVFIYSPAAAKGLAAFCCALLIGVGLWLQRNGSGPFFSLRGTLRALWVLPAAVALSAALTSALTSGGYALSPPLVQQFMGNGGALAFASLGLMLLVWSLVGAMGSLAHRWGLPGRGDLALAALCWWSLLLFGTTLRAPGASYLFAWPVLGAVGVLAAMGSPTVSAGRAVLLALAAAVLPLTFGGVLRGVVTGLGTQLLFVAAVLVALASALVRGLADALSQVPPRRDGATALLGVSGLALGVALAWVGDAVPGTTQLAYGLELDSGRARWMSFNLKPDPWTAKFLAPEPETSPSSAFSPTGLYRHLWGPAEAAALEGPRLEQLSDDVATDGVRTLRLRVVAPGATRLHLELPQVPGLREVRVQGRAPSALPGRSDRWGLHFSAPPPEGVELELRFDVGPAARLPLELKAVSELAGLPALPALDGKRPERPKGFMPSVSRLSDCSLVARTFHL